ncbi:hypothetical protein I601_1690 [Nocardioides dokdonensis FR1436]|uniref:Uncharacterized protein n=1 Tax=Nocardioides dokdonensis FR1436 TaxID=1300347 RepID=A0A1A9GKE1_9ACTN|nr:hypothetical protein [Nocardioides dokdonensis]ANH38122.1 hypothetical protein I601_1690 [Nocardioides dokdonensis FR1436]
MSMTRGSHAPAVYWRRRVVVLLVALVLVFGTARLFGWGSGDEAPEQAVQSAAAIDTDQGAGESAAGGSSLPTSDAADARGGKVTGQGKGKKGKGKKDEPAALPQPQGVCLPSDVRVKPVVEDAVAGRQVRIALELQTQDAIACTWEVSPRQVTLKISSGPDEIWTSRQCPRAVPTQEVVLRSASTTSVDVVWSSRRSDEGCSRLTEWALPGFYHVAAAALAGEPRDVQFELEAPVAPTITAAPEPEQKDTKGTKNKNKKKKQP